MINKCVFVCKVACLALKCNVNPRSENEEKRKGRWYRAKTNGGNFDMVVLVVQDKVVLMLYMTYCSFFAGGFHIVSECLLNIQ